MSIATGWLNFGFKSISWNLFISPIECLKELESEGRATRQFLERVPAGKFDWKPHEKSMKLMHTSKLKGNEWSSINHLVHHRGQLTV